MTAVAIETRPTATRRSARTMAGCSPVAVATSSPRSSCRSRGDRMTSSTSRGAAQKNGAGNRRPGDAVEGSCAPGGGEHRRLEFDLEQHPRVRRREHRCDADADHDEAETLHTAAVRQSPDERGRDEPSCDSTHGHQRPRRGEEDDHQENIRRKPRWRDRGYPDSQVDRVLQSGTAPRLTARNPPTTMAATVSGHAPLEHDGAVEPRRPRAALGPLPPETRGRCRARVPRRRGARRPRPAWSRHSDSGYAPEPRTSPRAGFSVDSPPRSAGRHSAGS